jgi:hypothetical protein
MQHNKLEFMSVAAFILLCSVTPLMAGPLDRADMGQRVNPATNNMLRVPGVVGMDYQSALASLQQAGLNPSVHRIHKEIKKYAGQEGTVIKQLPLPGGMAMLGSSVSITVYMPGDQPITQNNSYGTADPSSSSDDGGSSYTQPSSEPSVPTGGDANDGGGTMNWGSSGSTTIDNGTWSVPAPPSSSH